MYKEKIKTSIIATWNIYNILPAWLAIHLFHYELYYIEDDFEFLLGVCYGFEVMRISESPNTPFTCIYERFKKGI